MKSVKFTLNKLFNILFIIYIFPILKKYNVMIHLCHNWGHDGDGEQKK